MKTEYVHCPRGKGFDDGHIAAADRVHRTDIRIGVQDRQDETTHGLVLAMLLSISIMERSG